MTFPPPHMTVFLRELEWNCSVHLLHLNHHLFLPQCIPAFMGEKEQLDSKLVGVQSQDTHLSAKSGSPKNQTLNQTFLWLLQKQKQPEKLQKKKKKHLPVFTCLTVCCCCYWPHLAWCCFSVLVITAVLVMTAAILRDAQYINRLWALIPEHNLLFRLKWRLYHPSPPGKKNKQTHSFFLEIGVLQFSRGMHAWMRPFFQELGASGK